MNATNQATHTPGPWKIGPLGIICGGRAGMTTVAESMTHRWASFQCVAGERSQEAADWCGQRYREAEANARLIAAAPDYFALLVRVAALRKRWQDNDDFGTVDYVDALGDLHPEIEAALARVAP